MDGMVKSWLCGAISPKLSAMVPHSRSIAHSVWLAVQTRFLGNLETHALHSDAEFRTFAQVNLSVTDYASKARLTPSRTSANTFPTTPSCLHLQRSRPFHMFLEARNDLLLEELNQAHQSTTPSTALVAADAPHVPPVPAPSQEQQPPPSSRSADSGGAPPNN